MNVNEPKGCEAAVPRDRYSTWMPRSLLRLPEPRKPHEQFSLPDIELESGICPHPPDEVGSPQGGRLGHLRALPERQLTDVLFYPCLRAGRDAAKFLDMPVSRFRALVRQGILPPPVRIADMERWKVPELLAILDDSAARPLPFEDIER